MGEVGFGLPTAPERDDGEQAPGPAGVAAPATPVYNAAPQPPSNGASNAAAPLLGPVPERSHVDVELRLLLPREEREGAPLLPRGAADSASGAGDNAAANGLEDGAIALSIGKATACTASEADGAASGFEGGAKGNSTNGATPNEGTPQHQSTRKQVKFNDKVEYFPSDSREEDEELHLRRVIASSIVGNTLEWYDFLIYTFLGGVITKLFFPHENVYAQMIAFYGVFAAGFATRPLGALVFGMISDRYSRKTALMLSIVVMSIPTALVGCLPTYQTAGLAAPLLLVLIRVLQGFAVGGEFTATMVFLVEHAPPHSRGLHGSWAFASVMVGVIVGSLVAMGFNLALSEAAMLAWGWRVPFLLSILGSGVGVYIRRHLRDPVSEEQDDHHHHHGGGRRGPLRRVAGGILMVVLIDFMNALGFYLVVIFLPLYMQTFAHLSRRAALSVHTANMFLYLGIIPLGGWLSDKYGRSRVILLPALAMAAVAYPLWCLFKTGNAGAAWFAQAALVVLMATFTGALPATFVALFPAEYRCTGLSIGHNLSMAAFGGTAPIMATGLLRGTGDIASPAALLIIAAAMTAAGALMLKRWRIR
ncbi:hypothetical protein HXX76_004774 [Chlamydomonas incerta]|uniref:Major facilitator superfamily (MFS) profile domain-containing protein n=1 Tax=Chlamydomonas incerta TaxID=51695 RepID=A0A835T5Q7_CHLIN|nr:hypothetical protein HXX76_004774 [Chlamydomonas incerta]|eukprot:KAG2439417.1 hypothetical protein HXX76_004774 [Chlamydomonas incerta]